MKRLYLAKPYDKDIILGSAEDRFLRIDDAPTPEVKFEQDKMKYIEKWDNVLSSMFWQKGIYLEYIYALIDGVKSYNPVDFSVPILQPFKHARYMGSLLRFSKVIFPDGEYVKKLMPHGMIVKNLCDKAVFFEENSGMTGPFTALYIDRKMSEESRKKISDISALEHKVEIISQILENKHDSCLTLKDIGIDADA